MHERERAALLEALRHIQDTEREICGILATVGARLESLRRDVQRVEDQLSDVKLGLASRALQLVRDEPRTVFAVLGLVSILVFIASVVFNALDFGRVEKIDQLLRR